MNKADLLLSERDNFRFYNCVFAPYTGTKVYAYKTFEVLEPGDFAVVETPTSGFQVVKVVEEADMLELNASVQYKWLVGKVDFTQYQQSRELEATIITAVRKAENKRVLADLRDSIPEVDEVRKLVRL